MARFQPSPPGTSQDPDDRTLTIAAHALPGDRAFILPLGHGLKDFRGDLHLQSSAKGVCSAPVKSSLADKYIAAPPVEEGHWKGVLCESSLRAGAYNLLFKVIRDVPRLGILAEIFGIALLCFVLSLWLSLERMRSNDRWVIGGFGLCAWLLLLVRCELALRYALDTRFLDSHAISGVARSAVLLATLPGLVLLAAPFWRDYYLLDAEKNRAARKRLLNGLALMLAIFAQLPLVHSMWPNAPNSYFPLGGARSSVIWIVACVGIFLLFSLFIAVRYIVETRNNYNEQPPTWVLRCLLAIQDSCNRIFILFYRAATVIGPKLWESAEGQGPGWRKSKLKPRVQQDDDFYPRYISLVKFSALLLLLLWIVMHFGFATKWIQEILAAILICWLPACLLLSARNTEDPQRRLNWLRAGIIIATILLFSVVLFRLAVLDAGGIFAALTVFIPVAVLLALGGPPWSIRWMPLAMLTMAALMFAVLYVNFRVTARLFPETAASRILEHFSS